ncbi:MmcQ/YjbR family DNA-binding protein [Parvibaculum sp.]|uniref:MmcQ/YjbR family DNA-binding protein n=1 Tax=Parvibaculum sp. TaxID=2024848 RepID=UPI00391D8B4C
MPVTADQARKIALSLPEAEEKSHFDRPDFRVRNKIFASLHAAEKRIVVKLGPEEQAMLVESEPKVFAPVPGGWGRKGWTQVNLSAANAAILREAVTRGWRNAAPKTLVKALDAS